MSINSTLIIGLVAYVCGAITKIFITKIPSKFIPIQNIVIAFISALICYWSKIEANFLQAIVTCLLATMSAGGMADLVKVLKPNSQSSDVG